MADNSTKIIITAEDKTAAALSSIKTGLAGLQQAASAAGLSLGALGGAASIAALVSYSRNVIDAADAMNDLSQRVGVSIKDLAGFKLAAEQSGTSLDTVARSIKALSGYYQEHGDRLKEAGITATNASDAMVQLADVFAGMPDGIQKTALATQLFGKAGMEMIPMLNLGSKGLAEARESAKSYAEQLEKLAPRADEFNDRMAAMKLHAEAFGINVVNHMVDGILKIKNALELEVKAGPGSIANFLIGNHVADGTTVTGMEALRRMGSPVAGGNGAPAIDAQAAANVLLGQSTDKTRALKVAKDELAIASANWLKALDGETASLDKQIAAERDRIDMLGLSKEQQDQLAASKLDIAAAAKEEEAANLDAAAAYAGPLHDAYVQAATDLKEQAARLRELSNLKRESGSKQAALEIEKANQKAADDARREWEKVTDDINRSLTDAIMKGGMNGGELLKHYFASLVLRPVISAIMAPVTNAAGSIFAPNGIAGASGGGIGGGLGGASSLFGSLPVPGGGISAGYNSFALSGLGQTLGLSNAASFVGPLQAGQSGVGLTSFGQTVGNALPYVPYALAAATIVNQVSKGNPFGALFGSTIGGLFGGGGSDPHNNASKTGFNFGANSKGLFNVGSADNTGVSSFTAGATSGSGWWADSAALSGAQQKQIMAQLAATYTSGHSVAKLLGLDDSKVDSVSISSAADGTYDPKLGRYFSSIGQAMNALADKIAKTLMPNIASLAVAGETASQTLARLAAAAQATADAQRVTLGAVAANSDLFATSVDQQRAMAFASNGQNFSVGVLGNSFASATPKGASGGDPNAVTAQIIALRQDLRAIGAALADNTGRTARLLLQFDGDGLPATRVIA